MRWRKTMNAFTTRYFLLISVIYLLTCLQSVVDGRQNEPGGIVKKVYILMNPVNRTEDSQQPEIPPEKQNPYQNKPDSTPSKQNALNIETIPVPVNKAVNTLLPAHQMTMDIPKTSAVNTLLPAHQMTMDIPKTSAVNTLLPGHRRTMDIPKSSGPFPPRTQPAYLTIKENPPRTQPAYPTAKESTERETKPYVGQATYEALFERQFPRLDELVDIPVEKQLKVGKRVYLALLPVGTTDETEESVKQVAKSEPERPLTAPELVYRALLPGFVIGKPDESDLISERGIQKSTAQIVYEALVPRHLRVKPAKDSEQEQEQPLSVGERIYLALLPVETSGKADVIPSSKEKGSQENKSAIPPTKQTLGNPLPQDLQQKQLVPSKEQEQEKLLSVGGRIYTALLPQETSGKADVIPSFTEKGSQANKSAIPLTKQTLDNPPPKVPLQKQYLLPLHNLLLKKLRAKQLVSPAQDTQLPVLLQQKEPQPPLPTPAQDTQPPVLLQQKEPQMPLPSPAQDTQPPVLLQQKEPQLTLPSPAAQDTQPPVLLQQKEPHLPLPSPAQDTQPPALLQQKEPQLPLPSPAENPPIPSYPQQEMAVITPRAALEDPPPEEHPQLKVPQPVVQSTLNVPLPVNPLRKEPVPTGAQGNQSVVLPKEQKAALPSYLQAINMLGLPSRENSTDFLTQKPLPVLKKNYTVCNTVECHVIALSFKTLLNFSASPCHDFETFVCGNIKNSKQMPKKKLQTSLLNIVHEDVLKKNKELLEYPDIENPKDSMETVRAFYQGCVSADLLEADQTVPSVIKALKDVGGMPLLEDTGYNPEEDWAIHVAKVFKKLAVDVIIGFGIGGDVDNKNYRMLDISEPDDFGISRDVLTGKTRENHKTLYAYGELMKSTLCILRNGNCGEEQHRQIQDILAFEKELANLTSPFIDRTHYVRIFRKKTLSYVIRQVPEINWTEFTNVLFSNTGVSFSEESPLGFLNEEYFKKLVTVLSKTPKRTIGNYIGWRAFRKLPVFTMKPFLEHSINFLLATEGGVDEETTVQTLCCETASRLFPQSLGRLYVERYFHDYDKAQVQALVRNLKTAMRLMIDKNTWMDHPTKLEARKKLHQMEDYIGYPSWIFEDKALMEREHMYRNGVFDKHNFIDSMMRLYEERVSRLLGRIFVDIRQPEWPVSPAHATAYYDNTKNILAIPASILQSSFFQSNTLESLNYGAIGTIIGHEIMHAFDLNGGKYDQLGNEHTWWTTATKEAFNKKKQCFIDQYNSIVDKQTNMHLNGNLTVAENLNDHAGLAQAYNAFTARHPADVRLPGLEQYNPKQLFFIAYGRIWCGKYSAEILRDQILHTKHTPVMHRTYMPLRNVPPFAHEFNCPVGSLMNPVKRCDMWFKE